MFGIVTIKQYFKIYLIMLILCSFGKAYLDQGTFNLHKHPAANFDFFFENESCNGLKILPLVKLLNFIGEKHFSSCTPIILYEKFHYDNHPFVDIMVQLFETFPVPMIHGYFTTTEISVNVSHELFIHHEAKCFGFIVLTQFLDSVTKLLGNQPMSKVVLISQSSNWQMGDYLKSKESQQIVNLLVIADPLLQRTFQDKDLLKGFDINMYTHNLFVDPLGSSNVKLITAWRCTSLTRPEVNLFPDKIATGFNGYRFYVSTVHHPPFVFKKSEQTDEDDRIVWDGLEVRLLHLISDFLNFTLNFQEPKIIGYNLTGYTLDDVYKEKAEIGIGGIFSTEDTDSNFHLSQCYYEDCAVFISLTSLALAKYRAIMGPFRWEVWMTLTLTYLLAIFPISFSESHSFTHILKNPWEIENMFWYVFGTFTNCFTFTGKKSWSTGRRMNSTGLFIGTYWMFSIIVTAAYTGSIIAFITIPVFPNVIDNIWQLLEEDFRISTSNGSGWGVMFNNTGDPIVQTLFNELEVVPTLADGIYNITKSRYRRPYALLGPRELLKHVVQTNFTPDSDHRKSLFHVSQDCFVRLLVSLVFPKNATYAEKFNELILRALQHGLLTKLTRDIQWEVHRTAKGGLLQVSSSRSLKITSIEDRQLTLDDVQGMFLLLGSGFSIAIAAIICECFTCLYHKYRPKRETCNTSQVPSITLTCYDEQFLEDRKHSKQNLMMLLSRGCQKSEDHLLTYFGSQVIFNSYESHTVEINFNNRKKSTYHNRNEEVHSASLIIDSNKNTIDWLRRYSF